MLAYIKGTLEIKMTDYVVIDVGGLGYKVYMSAIGMEKLGNIGDKVKVYTYYRVREDDISIFGFNTNEELRMFELILSVSGVGAKTALTIIAVTEPSEFAIAVISDDVSYLTKIPGIGAKSAQRIILELKDKMKKENSITKTKNLKLKEAVVDSSKVDEAISALQVLGYNKKEIEKVFMKLDKKDLLLYAVTDRYWLNGRTLYEVVKESLDGGVTFLQLREKKLDEEHFLEEAKELQKLCKEYKVPFIINDNVDIAVEIGADGVHVGQSDMEAGMVREKLGPDKIIGVSAQTVEQALLAEKRGADYLGVGAVFPTNSKDDAKEVTYETLKEICEAVSIPVVAIGGITHDNIKELTGSKIDGIAVISAIYGANNIKNAASGLKEEISKIVE